MLAAYLPIRMTTAAYTARGSEKTPTTRTMQMARTRLWCNLRGEQELDLEAESATTTMIVRCYCTQDSQRRTCCVAVSGRAKLACWCPGYTWCLLDRARRRIWLGYHHQRCKQGDGLLQRCEAMRATGALRELQPRVHCSAMLRCHNAWQAGLQ